LRAGAHVDVHLPGGLVRQYSPVIDGREPPGGYVIAVKKAPDSRGGSRALHEDVPIGTELELSVPRNLFPLTEDAAYSVLVAGGIGITPVWSMLHRLQALGRPLEVHYACQTRAGMAFAAELAANPSVRLHIDAEAGTLLDIIAICARAPAVAHLYCCSPLPMLSTFKAATSHLPPHRVHVEYFASAHEAATEGAYEVELARSGMTLRVAEGQRIIDVVRAAGVNVLVSCEQGICGSCETRVISGVPDHRDEVLPNERLLPRRSNTLRIGRDRNARIPDIGDIGTLGIRNDHHPPEH
jgi:vanillate O-demethylase ferredoxin subunit